MTPDEAYAVFVKRGLYPYATRYDDSPTIVLARYTNYSIGVDDSDGNTVLSYRDKLVWVVTFTGVPVSGSGMVGDASEKPTPENIVTVVDDSTGEGIVTIVDLPDKTVAAPKD